MFRWSDRRLYYGETCANLSKQQLCVVEALIEARPRTLSHPFLFQRMWWIQEPMWSEVTLRVQILRARRAILATGCQENPIVALRGEGYRWEGGVECDGPAPLLIPTAIAAMLRRLLLTHPDQRAADRCMAAIWEV